jgi:hypothetical protein
MWIAWVIARYAYARDGSLRVQPEYLYATDPRDGKLRLQHDN